MSVTLFRCLNVVKSSMLLVLLSSACSCLLRQSSWVGAVLVFYIVRTLSYSTFVWVYNITVSVYSSINSIQRPCIHALSWNFIPSSNALGCRRMWIVHITGNKGWIYCGVIQWTRIFQSVDVYKCIVIACYYNFRKSVNKIFLFINWVAFEMD